MKMKDISTMTKKEFVTYYMREMARLFPNATMGMDYSIKDAEFVYDNMKP